MQHTLWLPSGNVLYCIRIIHLIVCNHTICRARLHICKLMFEWFSHRHAQSTLVLLYLQTTSSVLFLSYPSFQVWYFIVPPVEALRMSSLPAKNKVWDSPHSLYFRIWFPQAKVGWSSCVFASKLHSRPPFLFELPHYHTNLTHEKSGNNYKQPVLSFNL